MLCGTSPVGLAALHRDGWTYELKLDGVRIVADKRGHDVDLWYRSARSATRSYPEVARAVAELPVEDAVIDGEVVAFDADGRPSFQRLEQRIGLDRARDIDAVAREVPVAYVVFDLLALGARDLRELPLTARRAELARVVPDRGIVRRLDHLDDDGTPLFDMCRRERLEGVIAKRAASTYKSGQRATDWLKIKCENDEDFVVVGFTGGSGSRGAIGALDLATRAADGALAVRGKVGSGLDDKTMRALLPRLRALAVDAPVARGEYLPAPNGRTHVRPELVVSVRFSSWTDDGRVRHPVFRGVRHDVDPDACRAAPPDEPAATDEELAAYLARAADAILPYLAGRSSIAGRAALVASAPPFRMRTEGLLAFDADAHGALALRRVLDALGVPSFVKTGETADFHVLAPSGDAPPDGARALGELVAHVAGGGAARVARSPILAPWSPFAGAGSRVSTPLAWDEVKPALDPARLTTRAALARLAAGDPMAPLLAARVDFAETVARVEKRYSKG